MQNFSRKQYNQKLQLLPTLNDRLTVKVLIGPDGRVQFDC